MSSSGKQGDMGRGRRDTVDTNSTRGSGFGSFLSVGTEEGGPECRARSSSRTPSLHRVASFVGDQVRSLPGFGPKTPDPQPSLIEMLESVQSATSGAGISLRRFDSMPSTDLVVLEQPSKDGRPTVRMGSCPYGSDALDSNVSLITYSDIDDDLRGELDSLIAEAKEDDWEHLTTEQKATLRELVGPSDSSIDGDLKSNRSLFANAQQRQLFSRIASSRLEADTAPLSTQASRSPSTGLILVDLSPTAVAEFFNDREEPRYMDKCRPESTSEDWRTDMSRLVAKYAGQETDAPSTPQIEVQEATAGTDRSDEYGDGISGPPQEHGSVGSWWEDLDQLPAVKDYLE